MKQPVLVLTLFLGAVAFGAQPETPALQFTSDGELKRPTDYRDWVFLSSGLDMSYTTDQTPERHIFNNVFVNPNSYRAFLKAGIWPDGTMLLIEARAGASKGAINKRGVFQTTQITSLEVHVKDSRRFQGSWAFFEFKDAATAKMIPLTESCYACHTAHAAVDTTFVQFYPTLLDTANTKGTFSANYLNENPSP